MHAIFRLEMGVFCQRILFQKAIFASSKVALRVLPLQRRRRSSKRILALDLRNKKFLRLTSRMTPERCIARVVAVAIIVKDGGEIGGGDVT